MQMKVSLRRSVCFPSHWCMYLHDLTSALRLALDRTQTDTDGGSDDISKVCLDSLCINSRAMTVVELVVVDGHRTNPFISLHGRSHQSSYTSRKAIARPPCLYLGLSPIRCPTTRGRRRHTPGDHRSIDAAEHCTARCTPVSTAMGRAFQRRWRELCYWLHTCRIM